MASDGAAVLHPFGPDPQAIRTARALQRARPSSAVILFGSRARTDWRPSSDIDLMLVEDTTDWVRRVCRDQAYRMACAEYVDAPPALDIKFIAPTDYREQVLHSRNRIGAVAHREGITMRDWEALTGRHAAEDKPNPENSERAELEERLNDAHVYYEAMQGLLHRGICTKATLLQAHQALEHGLKALTVAYGREYPRRHDLKSLADQCDVALQSDRQWLAEYAGGARYGAPPFPSIDFRAMAHEVTDDMEAIFQRIAQLTETNPRETNDASAPHRW